MFRVCLSNMPRDVELMVRLALVGIVAIVDFHGYITVGPPETSERILTKPERKKLIVTGACPYQAILSKIRQTQASRLSRIYYQERRLD